MNLKERMNELEKDKISSLIKDFEVDLEELYLNRDSVLIFSSENTSLTIDFIFKENDILDISMFIKVDYSDKYGDKRLVREIQTLASRGNLNKIILAFSDSLERLGFTICDYQLPKTDEGEEPLYEFSHEAYLN